MPKFSYQCKECGSHATKPPLVAVKNWQEAKTSDFGGLGKWRCPKCGPGVAVSRSRNDGGKN